MSSSLAQKHVVMDEEADEAFDLFDITHKGFIDFEDLKRSCSLLGEDLTHDQLQLMLEIAGTNGRVNREEFAQLWFHLS
ncbi:EF hand family protein, centrin-like [Schizosaccharomyces osmophilus]|uniref:EF hand family protein, centrin-like n=1 Tax=Schizosaccharomyces osmophilus TaxID=2545709 RepID=A0AAE9WBR2_9SCHI|nr:EF hand family protein, centrin-like [Schizosaccharomyces osmophilus]WBW72531.1 EF hand family protein, centrin-like [Schizosaccharomyces osmophilus]